MNPEPPPIANPHSTAPKTRKQRKLTWPVLLWLVNGAVFLCAALNRVGHLFDGTNRRVGNFSSLQFNWMWFFFLVAALSLLAANSASKYAAKFSPS